jgi:hypothetical protein
MRTHPRLMQRAGISKAILPPGKVRIGGTESNPIVPEGFTIWSEHGIWYMAPIVDKEHYGEHDYVSRNVSQCRCGCWMKPFTSGGPCDPFGPCPRNPK